MKTKKILSFVLAAIMMLSLVTTSFAAETNIHELIYKNNAAYEIMIPATSNIDVNTGKGEIDLSVTNAKLENWTVVAITASSTNYNDGNWNLVNAKNSKDVIPYSIGTTVGANDIASGDRVFVTSEADDAKLYVTVGNTDKVGTFSDIITFTSEITVDLISFDIAVELHPEYAATLYAANGMTWEDWVNSEYNTPGIWLRNNSMQYPGSSNLLKLGDPSQYEPATNLIVNNGHYYFGMPEVEV